MLLLAAAVVPEPAHAADAPGGSRGRNVYTRFCEGCHGSRGQGIKEAGVSLAGLAARMSRAQTEAWIKHPRLPMPAFYPKPLSETDVQAVAAYVQTLKPGEFAKHSP
jgi:mono/diheme cytochrome c family protein